MEPIRTQAKIEFASQPRALRTAKSGRIALGFVALAATAVIAPTFFLGNASGHDFSFHVASWMDAAGQWREGIAYPRWAEWANWGFGEPRFIFYPPASWMLGAAFGSVLPWKLAPGIFIWLCLMVAGMAMWRLAREWLPGPQAIATGVLYAVNPYHIVDAYYRSDFAELLASALFPLLVWSAWRLIRDGWRAVPLLATVVGAIWLSNAPAAVIATYSLALLIFSGCVASRSIKPILPGSAGMAAGFGLAALYILPAAWEQRWVQISEVISENLHPFKNFLFAHGDDPEFVLFNWKVSSIAAGVILITGIAGVFMARQRKYFREFWWMLMALGAASVLLMFPLSAALWRHLPKLQFVQFPWRWLLPVDFVFAFFVAAAISRARRPWAWWLAVAIAIVATETAIVHDCWWAGKDVVILADGIRSGHGYEGTSEYAPLGTDRFQLPGTPPDSGDETPQAIGPPNPRIAKQDEDSGDIVPAAGVRLHVEQWTAERKLFSAETHADVTLALRLVNYPAWEIQADGAMVRPELMPDTAQLLVPLLAGAHQIEVRFRRTWDRTLGDAISMITALVLIAVRIRRRRRPESNGGTLDGDRNQALGLSGTG
jgi:6-pyruvoyl-tetrahydropterin synthase related domain